MTKKTTLKWRLGKLPTSNEVIDLVATKVITQEEAREILFSTGEEDSESLKSEIKFLRELISKLSDRNTIVEKIRYIDRPYISQPWYQPYYTWYNGTMYASAGTSGTITTTGGLASGTGSLLNHAGANSSASLALANSQATALSAQSDRNFTDIKTF